MLDVYSVRYVHRFAPSDRDVGEPIVIASHSFADRKALGKALREARVLVQGASVRCFRVEPDRIVVFPKLPGCSTYWHSIILTGHATAKS